MQFRPAKTAKAEVNYKTDNIMSPRNILWRATDVERDHQILVHSLIIGAAFLTYLIDRDDVVWRFIKNHGQLTRPLEHWLFLIATLMIGAGAWLCTAARRSERHGPLTELPNRLHCLGQFFYAVGLASLLPLGGYLLLIVGESIRLLRISFRTQSSVVRDSAGARNALTEAVDVKHKWFEAAQPEALKWCLLISMIVFTVTLRDRYADWLICASIVVGGLLNWRTVFTSVSGTALFF